MSANKPDTWFAVPVRSNIPVAEFSDYVLEMTLEDDYNNTPLTRQFSVGWCVNVVIIYILSMYVQKIPSAPAYPYTEACLPQNVGYNRFRNIYPCKIIYCCHKSLAKDV